jgi:hypothetical protein
LWQGVFLSLGVMLSLLWSSGVLAREQTAEFLLDEAIYACTQGNAAEAFALFDTIVRELSPPKGILALIQFYKDGQCLPVTDHKGKDAKAETRIDMAFGWNDNINQGIQQSTLVLDGLASSPRLLLSASMRPKMDTVHQVMIDHQDQSWQVMLNLKQYPHNESYQMGNIYATYMGDRVGISFNQHYIGGDSYFGVVLFDRMTKDSYALQWGLKMRHQHYANENDTGQQVEPFVQYLTTRWSLYAAMMIDRPTGQRAGGEKKGILTHTEYRLPIGEGVMSLMGYYHRIDDAEAYSPDLLETIRLHQLFWLRLRYVLPVGRDQSVYAEMSRLQSEDRLALYQYEASQFLVGWQYRW